MRSWPSSFAIALAMLVLAAGIGDAASAAPDPALRALAAKARDVRDYHFRAEWPRPAGLVPDTMESWYARPARWRTAMSSATWAHETRDVIIKGGEAYAGPGFGHDIAKLPLTARELWPHRWPAGAPEPVYLTDDYLPRWPSAQLSGAEVIRGGRCRIVDFTAPGPSLQGELATRRYERFVTYLPRTTGPTVLRLWVDEQTGLVRRWDRLTAGRTSASSELIETQAIDGIEFPSVIRSTVNGRPVTTRITEAAVNQGLAEQVFEFDREPRWLINDTTLSLDRVRELLKADPDNAGLHYTLARRRWDYAPISWEEARRELLLAAELAPDSPSPPAALAELYRPLPPGADGREAVEAARRFTAIAGKSSWYARTLLPGTLGLTGRWEQAAEEYRKLIAESGPPESYWAAFMLANACKMLKDHEAAYRALADVPAVVLATDPMSAGSDVVFFADLSHHLPDLEAKLRQAVADDPESPLLQILWARVLAAQRRSSEAREVLRGIRLPVASADEWSTYLYLQYLAEDLGDAELEAEMDGALTRDAILCGSPFPFRHVIKRRRGSPERLPKLIQDIAAVYAGADHSLRRRIVEMLAEEADMILYAAEETAADSLLGRDPGALSPAECVIQGIFVLGRRHGFDQPQPALRDHALACFRRGLERWPDDAALLALIGDMQWAARDWAAAAAAFEAAAAADPRQIEYQAKQAFACARLGRRRQALAVARKAIQPWADEATANTLLASVQMDCGRWEQARDLLAPVVADWDPSPQHATDGAAALLVRCHQRLGEFEQAEAMLKRLLDYKQEEPYRLLMEFYGRQGRLADAYAAGKALRVTDLLGYPRERDYAEAERALLRAFAGDFDALAAAARADVESHPEDEDAAWFAAEVERTVSSQRRALDRYHQAAERDYTAQAWFTCASAAEEIGCLQLAAEAFGRAVELSLDSPGLRARQQDVLAALAERQPPDPGAN